MPVARTLSAALAATTADKDEVAEARIWLKRTESFLDWVARHPKLVEVNAEAAHLLMRLRGK
jgi:hypothetical protein